MPYWLQASLGNICINVIGFVSCIDSAATRQPSNKMKWRRTDGGKKRRRRSKQMGTNESERGHEERKRAYFDVRERNAAQIRCEIDVGFSFLAEASCCPRESRSQLPTVFPVLFWRAEIGQEARCEKRRFQIHLLRPCPTRSLSPVHAAGSAAAITFVFVSLGLAFCFATGFLFGLASRGQTGKRRGVGKLRERTELSPVVVVRNKLLGDD